MAFNGKILNMKRILVSFLLVLFLSPFVSADIYQYVDKNGVVCYTDAPFNKNARKVMKDKNNTSRAQREMRRGPKSTSDYHSIIHKKAEKYRVDPHLVKAIIKTESNWNERAISMKGAIGLMQLMPSTVHEMNVLDPFNPEDNIEGGTKYLRYLLQRFNGDLTLALAAYNAGPKAIEKFGVVPPYGETKQYVKKVISLYNGNVTHPLPAGDTANQQRPERIYKIVLEDGTILFTNSSLLIMNALR